MIRNCLKANIYSSFLILNRNKCASKFVRLGVVCMAIAFIAVLVAVTIFKTMPYGRRSTNTIELKGGWRKFFIWSSTPFQIYLDTQAMIVKAIFSTTHIPNDDRQSLKIKNINDITNQVRFLMNYLFASFFYSLAAAKKSARNSDSCCQCLFSPKYSSMVNWIQFVNIL